MKKFILMLAISLGGIFSAQAQNETFNFNCSALAENVTLSVTAELSTPQMVSAIVGGYSVTGDVGEEILERTTGAGESFYLQHGSFYYGGADGFEFGPFAYRVFAQYVDANNIGGLTYHDNAEDALAALNVAPIVYQAAYPDADENQLLLAGFTIEDGDSTYSLRTGPSQVDYIPAPINGIYYWENADTDELEGTLAELLAYLGFN